MPRGHREPQHVGAGAGVPGRDRVGQTPDVGVRTGSGETTRSSQPSFADVVGVGSPLQHERVDEAAVEPHPGPHPRLRVVGLVGADEVVEFAVQMRHRQHRQHPGDRLVIGGPPLAYVVPSGRSASIWASASSLVMRSPRRFGSHLTEAGAPTERPKKKPAVMSSCDIAYAHQIGTASTSDCEDELVDADHRVRHRKTHRAQRGPRRRKSASSAAHTIAESTTM